MSDAPRITLTEYRKRFFAKVLEIATAAGFGPDLALEMAHAEVEGRDIDDIDLMFGDPEADALEATDLGRDD
jgi:hypothetical protein